MRGRRALNPPEVGSALPSTDDYCRVLNIAPLELLCNGKRFVLPYDASELPFLLPKTVREALLAQHPDVDRRTVLEAIKVLRSFGLGIKVRSSAVDCEHVSLKELKRGKLVYYKNVQIGIVMDGGTFYPYMDIVGFEDGEPITSEMVFLECVKEREAKLKKLDMLREKIRRCLESTGKPCYVAEYIALRLSGSVVIIKEGDSEIGIFRKEGNKLLPLDLDRILKELMVEDDYATYFTPTPANKATLVNALKIYSEEADLDDLECFVAFGNETYNVCSWISEGLLKTETKSTPFFFNVGVDREKVVEIARHVNSFKDLVELARDYVKGLSELSERVRDEDKPNLLMSFAVVPFCTRELKKVVLLTGPTLTGKSTTLNILELFAEDMVGYVNINRNDYRREVGVSDLVLKLYGVQDEISVNMFVNNIELIKSLVGCNKVTAWRLYKGNVTFKNRATLFFTLNEDLEEALKQRLSHADYEALTNRVLIIHYEEKMSREEAERLLKWTKRHKKELLEWALAMGRVLYKLGWRDYRGDLKAKVIDLIYKLKEEGSITVIKEDRSKICILKRDLTKVARALGLRRKDLEFSVAYYTTVRNNDKLLNVACVPR